MRIIEDFDKKDYEQCKTEYFRKAVRAIIFKDQKIALIKSIKFGEYKFPGGGIEHGEEKIDTLIRETKEESGLHIIRETIQPYGICLEKRKSIFRPDEIFKMESYYYTCEVSDEMSETNLDDYEIEYGYHLCFVTLDEAIKENKKALNLYSHQATWIERELRVLEELKASVGK